MRVEWNKTYFVFSQKSFQLKRHFHLQHVFHGSAIDRLEQLSLDDFHWKVHHGQVNHVPENLSKHAPSPTIKRVA